MRPQFMPRSVRFYFPDFILNNIADSRNLPFSQIQYKYYFDDFQWKHIPDSYCALCKKKMVLYKMVYLLHMYSQL